MLKDDYEDSLGALEGTLDPKTQLCKKAFDFQGSVCLAIGRVQIRQLSVARIVRTWPRHDLDAVPLKVAGQQDSDVIRLARPTLRRIFNGFVLVAGNRKAGGVMDLVWSEGLRIEPRVSGIPCERNPTVQEFLVCDGFGAIVHARSSAEAERRQVLSERPTFNQPCALETSVFDSAVLPNVEYFRNVSLSTLENDAAVRIRNHTVRRGKASILPRLR